ncbi:MAG: sulfatase [Myxococcaceae bacterium]|nr:sulfatase [Myxococcaceae bacterium]
MWGWLWPIRWALLANAYLLSPLALSHLLLPHSDVPLTLVLFTILASVLWLAVFQLVLFRRLWLAHAILFPFYLIVAIDLFVLINYKTRFSASIISVILENLPDAGEYIQSNLRSMLLTTALVLSFFTLCIVKMRGLVVAPPRWMKIASVAGLVVVYATVRITSKDFVHLASHDRNTPFGVFPQGYIAYTVYAEVLDQARRTKDFKFGAERSAPPPEPEVYVLILGESSRPHDWGIYGYPRDTTPHLRSEQNLVVFRDVVSQASFTKASVPLVITRAHAADQDRAGHEKSIVSVFREVGFRTYWLSTQTRDPFTGAINRYSGEADDQTFVERQHDEALLGMTQAALDDTRATGGKKFLVIHMMGSHFTYTNRYPPPFAVFPDQGAGLTERDVLRNSYDNTIVYTDHVLSEIFQKLKRVPGMAAALYVSDHGDNIKDDDRQLFGHFHSNEFDLPVPMLFWFSDAYAQRFPAKVAAARSAVSAPLSTRTVFYSLADLAGVHVRGPTQEPDAEGALSVFSPDRQAMPRLVVQESGTIDYDAWLREHRIAQAFR